jgi:hypothetical protein
MMMRAGVSYSDWRLMAAFQRRDYIARRTVEQAAVKKQMEDADSLSKVLGLLASRMMGF